VAARFSFGPAFQAGGATESKNLSALLLSGPCGKHKSRVMLRGIEETNA
jgi:hypothetical protein